MEKGSSPAADVIGTVTSPSVTLSPNARNFVRDRVGRRETVTGKVQLAVADEASVAVHVTVVEPSGKVEPDGGVQATVTGARPPVADGSV